jgi:hypothetical protein
VIKTVPVLNSSSVAQPALVDKLNVASKAGSKTALVALLFALGGVCQNTVRNALLMSENGYLLHKFNSKPTIFYSKS